MNFEKEIINRLERNIESINLIKNNQLFIQIIQKIAMLMVDAINNKKTIYWFGNGGSAADSQHLACELVNRFRLNRKAIPSVAFTENVSILTSVPNDYSFEYLFSRQVEAFVKKGDIVIALSTSGNSPNVIEGIKKAKELGAITIGFTGKDGGKLKDVAEIAICVPSDETPIIQEIHMIIGHILCDLIEKELFGVKR